MKKYLFTAFMIMISLLLNAQGDLVITGQKKITQKMTPQQVIDSLQKHFPNAKSVQYYKAPADSAKKGWTITEEDNLDSDHDVEYYTISFKRDGLKYYGLYNKDGELLKSRIEHTVTDLPEPIKTSLKNLAAQYPGYKVVSKTYYKNQDYSKSKEYYEVVASNGTDTKKLYYTPDGTLTKTK